MEKCRSNWITVTTLLLLPMMLGAAEEKSTLAVPHSLDSGKWVIEDVDMSNSYIGGPSLALKTDDTPYLFYNLFTENITRLAHRAGGTWEFETILSSASLYPPVLEIDASNNVHLAFLPDSFKGISYLRQTNSGWASFEVPGSSRTFFPIFDATMALDSGTNPVFAFNIISEPGPPGLVTKLRKGTFGPGGMSWLGEIEFLVNVSPFNVNLSLEVSESGSPHFITSTPVNDDIQIDRSYLLSHEPENTVWASDKVDVISEGTFSVDFVLDQDERDHIVFVDRSQGTVKYATNNLDGSTDTIFSTEMIDSVGISTGNSYVDVSLAVDQLRVPHVVYHDPLNKVLKYARKEGGKWAIQTIESVGEEVAYSDIAIDSKGNPVIAFSNALYPNNKVRLARFVPTPVSPISPTDSPNNVRAYPNPFRPSKGHSEMTFSDIPVESKIKIYTLTGELLRELTADSGGQAPWNGKNNSGEDVASGVYVAFIEGNGGKKNIKVAIQR